MDRESLLRELKAEGVLKNKDVERAFRKVDRKDFVPKQYIKHAYVNEPLPIGQSQTISQPYTVAFMLDALDLKKGQKVLDVGTGSGYAAALIAEIVDKVITIERIKELVEFSKKNLKKYKNIKQIYGDGSKGYSKEALYDRIIVAASSNDIPKPLFNQLKGGGILIIPIGQKLVKVKKTKGEMEIENLGGFVFVPLIKE